MIKTTESEGETLMVFANGHKKGLIKGKNVQYGSIFASGILTVLKTTLVKLKQY